MAAPEMALAVRPSMDVQVGASHEQLVLAAQILGHKDELMEKRRADRSEHQHKQIWTKDPHGGAYRKAGGATGGYDALLQLADGETRTKEPGYERPQTGPTTNFVGNHMTQGAIDMVQMEQQHVDPAAARRQLKQYRQYYHPPKRIANDEELEGGPTEPAAVQCQRYTWEDRGSTVSVRVPLPDAIPAAAASAHVQCGFGEKSLQLSIRHAADGSGRGPLVLRIHSLFAAVVPADCGWQLSNGSHFPRTADGGAAAGALVVAGTKPWVVCLTLRKADPSLPWSNLSNDSPAQQKSLADGRAPAISLTTLRSALRRQRAAKKPGDGLLYALPSSEGSEVLATNSDGNVPAVDVQVAAAAATDAAALGDHAEAVRQLTSAIAACNTNPSSRPHSPSEAIMQTAECLVRRAKSHRELGDLKAAVSDCSRALELIGHMAADHAAGAEGDGGVMAMKLAALAVRGHVLEQLERYTESAADFEAVVRQDPAGAPAAAAALGRVRGAAKAAAALDTAAGPQADSWTSVPRPGLRHFEHRGKAGTAF